MKLAYQKRVRLLPWVATLVGILVYWLALSETLSLRKEIRLMENDALVAENAPNSLNQVKMSLDDINEIIGDKTSEIVTDPLLELCSKQALENKAILSEYNPIHIYRYGNYQVETRVIGFEAPFISCLKVLYNIEKFYRYGKVVSVSYSTRHDYKTSKKYLTMKFLIQTIQNEKNVSKTEE